MFEIGILIAVVVALTQLVKLFDLPKKYLPVVSLVLGIVAGIFYVPGDIREQVMYGLMIGLSASGLFDQSKIITKRGE